MSIDLPVYVPAAFKTIEKACEAAKDPSHGIWGDYSGPFPTYYVARARPVGSSWVLLRPGF